MPILRCIYQCCEALVCLYLKVSFCLEQCPGNLHEMV